MLIRPNIIYDGENEIFRHLKAMHLSEVCQQRKRAKRKLNE